MNISILGIFCDTFYVLGVNFMEYDTLMSRFNEFHDLMTKGQLLVSFYFYQFLLFSPHIRFSSELRGVVNKRDHTGR